MNNLPTVTPRQAFEALKTQDTPEAKAIISYVSDIEGKNVVAIGTDNAFALTDQDGQIKAFKMALELSVAEGTLVEIGKSFGNYKAPVAISAQGYEKWAEKTGASVIFPKDVLVGETLKPNPYMERDPDNKRVLAVHARAVAFKYSPMGLPQVCDWSTIFDVPSYRMIDLLAKAKKTPQAFKLLPEGMEPPTTEKGNETWAKYPFDEATNLWLNTSHNEVLDWFKSIINREKKAMDFAQTFARRNALKHLSGLQKPPENAHQWSFPVLSWRPTGNNIIKWDASQYAELQNRVAGVIEGNTGEFDQGNIKQIEVRKGVEKISEELDNQEIETDINPDDPVETADQKPASNDVKEPEPSHEQTTEKLIEETDKVIEKERKQALTMQDINPGIWSQSCESLGFISDPMKLTTDQCIKAGGKMNSLIDGGNDN